MSPGWPRSGPPCWKAAAFLGQQILVPGKRSCSKRKAASRAFHRGSGWARITRLQLRHSTEPGNPQTKRELIPTSFPLCSFPHTRPVDTPQKKEIRDLPQIACAPKAQRRRHIAYPRGP